MVDVKDKDKVYTVKWHDTAFKVGKDKISLGDIDFNDVEEIKKALEFEPAVHSVSVARTPTSIDATHTLEIPTVVEHIVTDVNIKLDDDALKERIKEAWKKRANNGSVCDEKTDKKA